jgi:hypothetical protein
MTKYFFFVLSAILIQGTAVGQYRIDSPDWPERYQAFVGLSAQLASNPANKQKLTQLLRRETKVIQDTLNASNGQVGVSSTYGEEFGEYYSMLLGKVFEFAKADEDPDALRAVAAGGYDPRSRLATELVSRWKVTAPVLLDFRQDDGAGLWFASALEMMGRMLGAHREEMPESMVSLVEDRLMQGLLHPHFGIRRSACLAAGDANFKAAIPVLRRIGKEDRESFSDRAGKPVYPGREVAAKALQQLEK